MEEIEGSGVSLINEPVVEAAVELRPGARQRSFHATLCEARAQSQALLSRLESGVHCAPGEGRAVVRELYVAKRRQVQALAATLELEELE